MKISLKLFLTIIVTTYSYLTFLFAFNGYPGFIQDSTCFLPTAYFINHYHQLINPLYDAGIDPIQHRFLFYPPLFPWAVAFINNLMPEFYNNMQVTLAFIDILGIIVLIISVWVYSRKTNLKQPSGLLLFSVIWLLALFSFYGVQEGRPEVLCKFFIACFLLNNVYQSKRFCNFNNGLLVALNLITSPVSTFYLMLITFGLLVYRNEFKLKPIVQTLIGFAIISGIFTIVYPYHLIELIKGLQKHSQNVIVNRFSTDSFKNFITFYVTYAYAPLLIFNFLITIIYTAYVLIKKYKILSLVLLAILTCLVSYFSFKDMPMNYNMLVLSPVFFFVIFVMFSHINNIDKRSMLSKVSPVMIVVLLCINSVGFIRKTLLFYTTKNEKVSYLDFRKEFIGVTNHTNSHKKVCITFSLWPYCLDQYQHITLNMTDTSIQYLMLQQLYSGVSEPQPQTNFHLVKNNFIIKHPKLWKIPLGNTYPWFQTATYERK
ncbi:hypothetical protein [Mucilaginibacter arboris]|uniref:Glycosyltransferase RgtA/B/C/D-like domain-containing protein n=1 Tax=Mucilaginibacter arboris TaxID=2682090 RepID=A0A7K1SX28_9SPHI|nr:hypothetical protein [Mucilaginibacter arboris]MVN21862.1 hypothetical protein [Mucilaginibacter arboris]